MAGAKKRVRDDTSPFKRKKSKMINSTDVSLDPTLEVKDDDTDNLTAELLDAQTIREGMLLLGCVTDIKATSVVMSLPGCLSGTVPMNCISNAFTESLKKFADNSELDKPSVNSLIKVGMVFPCKVVQISQDVSKRKQFITLSINPQDVNAELKPSSLYSKMVLFVSVCSVEDHGYIVDVGNKYIHGFVTKQNSEDKSQEVKIGEVLPACIKKINVSSKTSANIQLSKLDFNQDFPEISVEDVKLHSILPGAKIRADVIEVKHPFIYMKYLCFDACASVLALGSTHKTITVGSTILGTVLYVHPITHMIYLMLNLKPTPDLYPGYFGLKKFGSVTNLKFQCFYKNCAYYRISKGTYGFIKAKDLPDKGSASSVNNTVSKACVLFFHYMDNLVQMTAKQSMTEKTIVLPEDVQIGNIYEAVVRKHVQDGMFVQICPGLFGFIRQIHMSDVFVTKPEILHSVGSKIRCRVLSTDGKGKLNLTCKESLLNLQDHYILSSYEYVQKGHFYKGVIVKKTDEYILVLFFNNVKGVVPSSYIPEESIFYEGQTVLCKILKYNPLTKQLKLSLKTEEWCSVEESDDFWDKPTKSSVNTENKEAIINKVNGNSFQILHAENSSNQNKTETIKIVDSVSSDKSSITIYSQQYELGKPVEAVIMSVKGNQLNILLNKTKGRVHITELGCKSEDIYPLKKFSAGEKIKVYIIGEYTKKKRNFLEISHKNFKTFKECSLNFPPVSLSQDFKQGSSLIGFVKEVHDTCAVIWLSHTETGVLDYLHYSDNPKVIKKLRRHLKVGLSLKVSILENEKYSGKDKNKHNIRLTKIEKSLPQVGKNIHGLVQIACFERGLVLMLPFGYRGVTAVTDLTDIYATLPTLFDQYRKLKFVLCHVLEVNHQTKYCQLSLRKSRVCGKKIAPGTIFCPEITQDSFKEGQIIKGFVKCVSDSSVTVVFGRNLEGKVQIHSCTSTDCGLCSISKSLIAKYPVGSVTEVIIERKSVDGRSSILMFADFKNLENTRCKRLNVTEDISWDEIKMIET